MDDNCEAHHEKFAGKAHPDGKHNNNKHLHEHQRAAGHPAKHTKGQFPSQLQPDHGPHK